MQIHAHIQRARLRLLRLVHPERVACGDPFAQIFVDPKAIAFAQQRLRPEDCRGAPLSRGVFCRKRAVGLVIGGDWHSKVLPYRCADGLLFRALHDRYHGYANWQGTAFFQAVIRGIQSGERPWKKCASMADLEARWRAADALIASIKTQGFRINDNPIRVSIGPQGQLIKNSNGRHRIALGLITGQRIPVQVLVRHSDWEQVRRSGQVPEGLDASHPDLAGCRSTDDRPAIEAPAPALGRLTSPRAGP